MRKPPSAPDSKNILRQYKAVAISVAVGAVVSFLLLCLFAFAMSIRDLPHSAVVPLAVCAVVAGSMAAGYCCGKMVRARGLIYGLLCGSVIFLLAFLSELALVGQGLSILMLYKYVIYAVSGMIGGILGVNKRRKIR